MYGCAAVRTVDLDITAIITDIMTRLFAGAADTDKIMNLVTGDLRIMRTVIAGIKSTVAVRVGTGFLNTVKLATRLIIPDYLVIAAALIGRGRRNIGTGICTFGAGLKIVILLTGVIGTGAGVFTGRLISPGYIGFGMTGINRGRRNTVAGRRNSGSGACLKIIIFLAGVIGAFAAAILTGRLISPIYIGFGITGINRRRGNISAGIITDTIKRRRIRTVLTDKIIRDRINIIGTTIVRR
jgi:hypothetical protein